MFAKRQTNYFRNEIYVSRNNNIIINYGVAYYVCPVQGAASHSGVPRGGKCTPYPYGRILFYI